MEKSKAVKRLYVGGLGPTISQAELKERFSKFGDVADVEIVSRKDEQGNPSKTFAYLNISIAETELKKCMSLLNKTQWRGGILQIELAKESFLHRLAQERQEAKEKMETPRMDSKSNLVQSMKKAGVENFQMKAVPGTEVPDHKDWVVSKFGRVLPVLHLRGQHTNKVLKYDPSKYCHNIKRLEEDSSDPVPIAQLTWHLDEGDDDISRKRRGEFPTPNSQLKKKKGTQVSVKTEDSRNVKSPPQSSPLKLKKHNVKQVSPAQRTDKRSDCLFELSYANIKQFNTQGSGSSRAKNVASSKANNSMLDSEDDSEEEIKGMMVSETRMPTGIPSTGDEDFNVEVVKDNFELKYATHWAQAGTVRAKDSTKGSKASIEVTGKNSDYDYDSADTDEIIAVTKPLTQDGPKNRLVQELNSVKSDKGEGHQKMLKTKTTSDSENSNALSLQQKCKKNAMSSKAAIGPACSLPESTLIELRKGGAQQEMSKSKSSSGSENHNVLASPQKSKNNSMSSKTAKGAACSLPESTLIESSLGTGSESDSQFDSSGTEGDTEYEEMIQNCHRINLTLNDLERLASTAAELSGDESMENTSTSNVEHAYGSSLGYKSQSTPKALGETPLVKKLIKPDDIVSSILEEESTDDEHETKSRTPWSKLPAFSGLGSLTTETLIDEQITEIPLLSLPHGSCSEQESAAFSLPPCKKSRSSPGTTGPSVSFDKGRGLKPNEIGPEVIPKAHNRVENGHFEVQSNSSSSEEETKNLPSRQTTFRGTKPLSRSSDEKTRNSKSLTKSGLAEKICDVSSSESSSDDDSSSDDSTSSSHKNLNCHQKPPKSLTEVKGSGIKGSSINSKERKSPTAPLEKNTESPYPEMSKQLIDNEKRLAAVQERQKEIDVQKKYIQGALSNMDSQTQSKGRHIVFDSDGEDSAELEENAVGEEIGTENVPETKAPSKMSSKLFESSDEEDAEEEGGDDQRFNIKSQFEGKAGEKLMHLQSRFGMDERFRMDSRFLGGSSEEEDADEAKQEGTAEEVDLVAEKKKNLEILSSLLHINIEHPKSSKQTTKAKTFKDVNTLQYDPTKEDHAIFERKVEDAKKESKAKRKKIRAEAEKMPEVSREIYHDVAVDFKEVFGAAKPVAEERKANTPWDQEEERAMEVTSPAGHTSFGASLGSGDQENPAGFTFSFFGADEDETPGQEEPYKTEMIKPSKVAWQENKRFQDSSEEDEEAEEQTIAQIKIPKTSAHPPPEKDVGRFFFFSRDDERLKEGPAMFWRASALNKDIDAWEERRASLLEECRKRHKDAKRKIKGKP